MLKVFFLCTTTQISPIHETMSISYFENTHAARAERAILAAKRVAEEQAAGAAAEERVAAATEEAAEARQAAERGK